jgi:hypothetical protein
MSNTNPMAARAVEDLTTQRTVRNPEVITIKKLGDIIEI